MDSAVLAVLEAEGLVRASLHSEASRFLLILEPGDNRSSLLDWAASERDRLRALLQEHAAILFRGFSEPATAPEFQSFIEATCAGALLEYTQGSTPREAVSGMVSTATVYPSDRSIPLHNELSYAHEWPRTLWFQCHQPAEQGGATPLADSRRVFAGIDSRVRDRFIEHGVMYVRNYGELIDVPWQESFLTDDKQQVEELCEERGIEYEWLDRNGLRTEQVCQAVAEHPVTGETVWFNQAHLFNVASLPTKRRDQLVRVFGERGLPRNSYFGNGEPIDNASLEAVRASYDAERVAFSWQAGDVLMVDNMLAAHGRDPFSGERAVWVGMAEAHGA